MPRKPRTYCAGIPCHVIQRGNNRAACFFTGRDYLAYLEWLEDACRRFEVAVHAYVLMTNHVHMLLTPSDDTGVSRVMQSLGRRYVQYFNRSHGRTGTLWESRHRASLVEADAYLLSCYRYIELNPVRANMVSKAADYHWSSHRHNAGILHDSVVTEHQLYESLGGDRENRTWRYRTLFERPPDPQELSAIRQGSQFSTPIGSESFKRELERRLGVSFVRQNRGRPRKAPARR